MSEQLKCIPIGWISIEEYLPNVSFEKKLFLDDYFLVNVKNKDGDEFYSKIVDHNTWYDLAKEANITHWFNKKLIHI